MEATIFKTKVEPKQRHREAIPPTEMEPLHDPFGQTHNSCRRRPYTEFNQYVLYGRVYNLRFYPW